jgi:hypothetical protein
MEGSSRSTAGNSTTEPLGKVLLDDSKKTSRHSSTLRREAPVWIAKRTNPSSEEGKITNPKIKASIVVLLASTVFATGCGGDEQAQNESAEEQYITEQNAGTEAQTRETEAKGDEKVKEGNAGSASSG